MIRRFFNAVFDYLRTPPGEVPRHVSRAINDEIESHLALSVRDRSAQGISRDDARRRAVDEFGDMASAVRGCQSVWYADQNICHWVHLGLTAVLLVAAAYWFVAGRSKANPQTAAATGDLHGWVADEHSQPIGQAHILAVVKTWPSNGYRQQAYMTSSGPDGTFRIDNVYATDQQYEVQLAVVANGRLLESKYVSDGSGQLAPFTFTLRPSAPIVLRFQAAGGGPMAGVEVFPHRRVGANGRDDSQVYFCSADPIVQRSNDEGLARLPYFRDGDQATFCYRAPGREWETRDVVIPPDSRQIVLELEPADAATRPDSQQRGA